MDCEFRYRLTQNAERDIDEILSYLTGSLSNPQAAANFMEHLQQTIDEACHFPKSGTPVENEFLPSFSLRKKFIGHYVLYYLPENDEKTLYIVRVLYGKRDPDEILRELNL